MLLVTYCVYLWFCLILNKFLIYPFLILQLLIKTVQTIVYCTSRARDSGAPVTGHLLNKYGYKGGRCVQDWKRGIPAYTYHSTLLHITWTTYRRSMVLATYRVYYYFRPSFFLGALSTEFVLFFETSLCCPRWCSFAWGQPCSNDSVFVCRRWTPFVPHRNPLLFSKLAQNCTAVTCGSS